MRRDHLTPLAGSGQALERRADVQHAIRRIRAVVLDSALDCNCRDRVNDALLRLEQLERRREQKRLLAAARDQRLKIAALVDLLREIDELGTGEPDDGVLTEAGLLFDDIASLAERGAVLVREMFMLKPPSDEAAQDESDA